MTRRLAGPVSVVLALVCAAPAADGQDARADTERVAWEEAVAWARSRAIPLDTCEPRGGLSDLRALAASIGSARVVGMGEATHGTREFFRLKHRVFRYLVEEHGFRLFGLEASYAGCLPIDRYVQTGEGDPRELVHGQGFWTWDTQEVLELVEWMREHNARCESLADRVHFYGFDTQDSATPLRLALEALSEVVPSEAQRLEQRLAPAIETRYASGVSEGPLEVFRDVMSGIDELETLLSEHGEALRESRTERGAARVRFAARAGRFAVSARQPASDADDPRAPRNVRDETMAEVVAWALDQHGGDARMMLWAHDGHVTKHRGDPARDRPFLGSFLEARYGDDYVPVGFSFAEGGFQALYWPRAGEDWARRVLREYRIPGVLPGSIDHWLSEVGAPQCILDLRPADGDALPPWLAQPRRRRSIGGPFDADDADGDRFTESVVLPDHFELVAFVHTTSRAVPLRPPARFRLGASTASANGGGVRVTSVSGGSIAQRAGLRAGDVVVELAGHPVADADAWSLALSRLDRPGDVAVPVLRPGTDGGSAPATLALTVPPWVGSDG